MFFLKAQWVLCVFGRCSKDISSPFLTALRFLLRYTPPFYYHYTWRTECNVKLLAIACWQLFPIANNCTRWHSIFEKAPLDRGMIEGLLKNRRALPSNEGLLIYITVSQIDLAGQYLYLQENDWHVRSTLHDPRVHLLLWLAQGMGTIKKCKPHFCFIFGSLLFQNTGPFFLLTCLSNLVKLAVFNALYALCFHYRCFTSFLIISFLL